MKHVRCQRANIEPVFFAYPDDAEIDAIVAGVVKNNAPEYDFTAAPDGFGHNFWVIRDRKINDRITEIFKDIPALYVADGHHRTAAAARVGQECPAQESRPSGRRGVLLLPGRDLPGGPAPHHRLQPRGERPERADARPVRLEKLAKGFHRGTQSGRRCTALPVCITSRCISTALVQPDGPGARALTTTTTTTRSGCWTSRCCRIVCWTSFWI